MKYELEMLSLGNADSSIVRFYNEKNWEFVVLIDAGNPGDGEKIVNHINRYTNQQYVDLAICTHPDKDHIGGFFTVVEKLKINEFWIHDPTKHVDLKEVRDTISLVNVSKSLKYLTESFNDSQNLLSLIDSKEIPRYEPFSGKVHPQIPIIIVGPSEQYYEELLSGFRDIDHLFKEAEYLEKSLKDKTSIAEESESLSETLDEKNDKSNENNSSAITAFVFDDKTFLFTADAGPDALAKATQEYNLEDIFWMQIPHHGSKYNLTSDLIKHFNPSIAYVSASGSKSYPSRAVINSFRKINCRVYSTQNGSTIHNSIDDRPGYSKAIPL